MKTNDLKKGHMIRMSNGWFAIMGDNMRGNIRVADVDGICREARSVYMHDVTHYRISDEQKVHEMADSDFDGMFFEHEGEFKGYYAEVEHTPKQVTLRAKVVEFERQLDRNWAQSQ